MRWLFFSFSIPLLRLKFHFFSFCVHCYVSLLFFFARSTYLTFFSFSPPIFSSSYQVRSGRFDRVVKVQLPDEAGRKDILAVHARKLNLGEPNQAEATLALAAAITPGASGAEVLK